MALYIFKRCLFVIPTLIAISIVSFAIINLPPGDYVDRLVAEGKNRGENMSEEQIAGLRTVYGLDRPITEQYIRWISDIVLRGDFGDSFRWNLPVSTLIGERLLLTVALSLSTLFFIWIVAIPIGILSAVKQYSIWDYVFTFIGFIGLAIPNFLIALALMYVSFKYLGQSVGGLFSPEYLDAPWSLEKVLDLTSHIWIPMVVLGTAGTAALIRTLRANMLDELRRPYVVTARAKGLSELRLIIKYPLRHALNPFVSSLNDVFVNLVSGGTIVAVVLGLQTIGPLLLEAFRGEDMFLAGSAILMMSMLAVMGTLFSDLLLAWLDPRIRLR
ncbi:MAG: ABC transporter permease [Anaerolineae bacterium]|nr:ABC transporter permease [Anaerolineae bacterium]